MPAACSPMAARGCRQKLTSYSEFAVDVLWISYFFVLHAYGGYTGPLATGDGEMGGVISIVLTVEHRQRQRHES
jgi:hypothetical protein